MGQRMRAHDWRATPLGPIETWPQSLKTATSIVLRSPVGIVMLWGADGVMIYNDAYSVFAGGRHPQLLGSKVREGWPEVADFNDHVMKTGLAGGTLSYKDQELILHRNGAPELVWLDLDYSPVLDESGRPAGVIAIVAETTERVLAERRNATEREHLAQMFEQAPGFVCTLRGPEHVYEFVNAAHRRMFNSGDWVGRPLREAFPDLEGQGFYELMDTVYVTGERFVAHGTPMRFRSGPDTAPQERLVDFIYAPMFDERGAVCAIFCEGYDVTEQRRTEIALKDSQQRMQLALDAGDMGTFVWLPDEDVAEGDARMMALFGLPADGLLSLRTALADSIHPEDGERYAQSVARACDPNGSGLHRQDIRVFWPDGSMHWLAISGQVYFEGHPPRAKRMVGMAFDVSEQRRAEEALRELNDKLESRVAEALAGRKLMADLVEGADAVVLVLDLDFRLLAINQAGADEFERVFGVRPIVGENHLDALAHLPEQQAAVRAAWTRALQGEAYIDVQMFGDPNRDQRHYELRFNVLRDAAGERIGAYQFVYDVTERLRDQARLAEAEAALHQSQKMETVGQLTGGVAHDFNNLLMPIVGALDMLRRKLGGDDRAQRLTDAALQAADRAQTLVQRLLAFSRRQHLQPRAIDTRRLIESLADLVSRSLGPRIWLQLDIAPDLPPAHVDPNQLELALLNLAVNARDAMSGEGTLTIRARAADAAEDQKLGPGAYVSIAVTDTGVGMDEETLRRATEPFYTTKGVGRGTGLGLSSVQGLAAQSDGAFALASEPGRGTTATLWLPISTEPVPVPPPPLAEAAAPRRSEGGLILLVDDEDLVRVGTADMLTEAGYQVQEAVSGFQAVQMLKQGLRPLVVVTDYAMPGMTGAELAREVTRLAPGLPVLMITGYAALTDRDAGGPPRLAKPFRQADLLTAIEDLAKVGAPAPEET